MITQKELKAAVHYNPETGVFTWKICRSDRMKAGDIAGCLNNRGYLRICIDGKVYLAHRLAWLYMTGEWPKGQIDHIKHVRHDNRWVNLREATHQENQKNQTRRKDNTSGVCGVVWHKPSGKWQSQISVNDKSMYLGIFIDKFEAICARMSANNKYGFHENHGK